MLPLLLPLPVPLALGECPDAEAEDDADDDADVWVGDDVPPVVLSSAVVGDDLVLLAIDTDAVLPEP